MADGTTPTGATPPFVPDQQMLQQIMQQIAGGAVNPSGGGSAPTQTSPSVPPYQVPQPPPPQRQRTDNTPQPVGPGQGGARRAAEMKNFGASLSNTVNQLVYAHQQRKAREDQKVFDNFAQSYKGLQDAQAQMDDAARAMDEAKKKGDQQGYLDAAKKLQQAQAALKQNRTNLDDIASDPKKRKILAKGFGIDDKNAATPERQQAIAAVRKQTGVGGSAGDLISKLPQTQQLTPQAQGQAMARQAGVQGAPPTQGQVLKYLEDIYNHNNKIGMDELKQSLQAYKNGLIPERQGDGTYKLRPMTQEERGQYQLATKGVLAWTMKDGKPLAALRNPQTNQIIPGSENPDLLPPAYLTERIHEGEFTFTDAQGNVFRVPTTSKTSPVLPKGGKTIDVKPSSVSSAPSKTAGGAQSSPVPPTAAPQGPKGSRFVGKTNDPAALSDALLNFTMAPAELPGFGKARSQALEQAMSKAKAQGKTYDAGQADIWYAQAKQPSIYLPLKYLESLTGKDNKSGNLSTIKGLSDLLVRTNYPAINGLEMWYKLATGDPQVAAYKGAMLEVSDQLAKILQGGGSGGGTSDAKIRQAGEILDAKFSAKQIAEITDRMRELLANRKQSLIGENPWLQREYGGQRGGFTQNPDGSFTEN